MTPTLRNPDARLARLAAGGDKDALRSLWRLRLRKGWTLRAGRDPEALSADPVLFEAGLTDAEFETLVDLYEATEEAGQFMPEYREDRAGRVRASIDAFGIETVKRVLRSGHDPFVAGLHPYVAQTALEVAQQLAYRRGHTCGPAQPPEGDDPRALVAKQRRWSEARYARLEDPTEASLFARGVWAWGTPGEDWDTWPVESPAFAAPEDRPALVGHETCSGATRYWLGEGWLAVERPIEGCWVLWDARAENVTWNLSVAARRLWREPVCAYYGQPFAHAFGRLLEADRLTDGLLSEHLGRPLREAMVEDLDRSLPDDYWDAAYAAGADGW